MKKVYGDVFQDAMEDGDDALSLKSARDGEFLSLSRFTVYHSAQDIDNPRVALFEDEHDGDLVNKVSQLKAHTT